MAVNNLEKMSAKRMRQSRMGEKIETIKSIFYLKYTENCLMEVFPLTENEQKKNYRGDNYDVFLAFIVCFGYKV